MDSVVIPCAKFMRGVITYWEWRNSIYPYIIELHAFNTLRITFQPNRATWRVPNTFYTNLPTLLSTYSMESELVQKTQALLTILRSKASQEAKQLQVDTLLEAYGYNK